MTKKSPLECGGGRLARQSVESVSTVMVILLFVFPLAASNKKIQRETLTSYIQRMQKQMPALTPASPGSLWDDNGRLVGVTADYKAARVGDVIAIIVSQDVFAQNNGNVP